MFFSYSLWHCLIKRPRLIRPWKQRSGFQNFWGERATSKTSVKMSFLMNTLELLLPLEQVINVISRKTWLQHIVRQLSLLYQIYEVWVNINCRRAHNLIIHQGTMTEVKTWPWCHLCSPSSLAYVQLS